MVLFSPQVVEKALNILTQWNGARFINSTVRMNKPEVCVLLLLLLLLLFSTPSHAVGIDTSL